MVYVSFMTIALPAYVVRIFEMPLFRNKSNPVFDSYFNSVYFTIITIQTIGYGEIVPGTLPGKVVILILSFWGAIVTT